MIVFLDTNVYIGANYIFDSGNLSTLKNLANSGKITVLNTSATIGEVKQHIKDDISAAVKQYNRVLRKEMPVLNGDSVFNLNELDEDQVIDSVTAKLNDFIRISSSEQISLNPLDAEKLLDDYFNKIPPFESKKPNEFKDAIMINAVKQFQSNTKQQICIVSNDKGLRQAFSNNCNYIVFEYLSGFLKHYNQSEEELASISEFISDKIDDCVFDEVIKEYLSDFDIDRGYYGEWNCDSGEIEAISCELLYIEENDKKYIANISIDLDLAIDITYRDEDTSYYDKDEDAYLIENFIHAIEKHRVTINIAMVCEIEKTEEEMTLKDFYVVEDKRHKYINLDENTMFDSEEIENTLHEEPDLEYCSECGSLLGRTQNGAYSDYDGNPICINCAVSNSKGDICPMCGRKVPHEYMMSGFCKDCAPEAN